jgi:dienelactone hydrolase
VSNKALRASIKDYLRLTESPNFVTYHTVEKWNEEGYARHLVEIEGDESDRISAYLLMPEGAGPFPAVQVHHQHASQRHLGKSEVCGLAGDPWQAFGPALAQRGIVVLASDSLCFEDRRRSRRGIEPDEAEDHQQHYKEMSYRLVCGDTLMRKVLDDAQRGISMLVEHSRVDRERIGLLGHSYGGNTSLFQAALDERISFVCVSGAICSYEAKLAQGIGLEMALVIPGFAQSYDFDDLISCVAPRRLLILSATEDESTYDANQVVELGMNEYKRSDKSTHLEHRRYEGGHRLDADRFKDIVEWIEKRCQTSGSA